MTTQTQPRSRRVAFRAPFLELTLWAPIALFFWVLLPTVAIAAEVTHLAIGDPGRKDKTVPVVLDAATDTRTGELLSPSQLAARLAGVDILLIGESHTDIESHQLQLRIIEQLHRSGRQVLIGLEMFPYSQQEVLDRWTQGDMSGDSFVAEAEWYRYWGYHWNYYRDIFLFARDNHLRMFGINAPRALVSKVRKEGFESLSEEEREYIPERIDTSSAEHRQMFKAFFDDDDALHAMLTEEAWDGMYRAQCTWDATMGWNALRALRQHGGKTAIMVVMIGSGHVTYGLGAQRQIGLHFDGKVAGLIPVEVDDDDESTVQASFADFVWGVPEMEFELYPSLGVSLSGSIGPEPRKIIRVGEHSPAEVAGLEVGDVLLALGNTVIDASPDLRKAVSFYRWGDVAPLRFSRGDEERTVEVAFRRVIKEEDEEGNKDKEKGNDAKNDAKNDAGGNQGGGEEPAEGQGH